MDKKGVTLIELIVVISITVIIMSIAIPMYNRWVKKESVSGDVQKIYSTLNELRLKAFVGKEECKMQWANNPFKKAYLYCGGKNIGEIKLKNNFEASMKLGVSYVDFSYDGTADHNGNIHVKGDNYGFKYSCVNISVIRISLGKWNGNSCENE